MSHEHIHTSANFGKAFTVGIALNAGFVLIEAFYAWQANSLALFADAGHNLSDVGALILAWVAIEAGHLHPDPKHTYGWRRGSILASFTNAVLLLVVMGSLAWEAIQRFQTSVHVEANTVMLVAGIGVVINAVTAWLFVAGSKHDLNIRGAFLHMAADALISLGVMLGGGLSLWLGWTWIDPVISLAIAVVIVISTWALFKQSLHLLFDGVPEHIDLEKVKQVLLRLPHVITVHDLHVWAMGTTETALTAHLVINDNGINNDDLLNEAVHVLHDEFEITHSTLQCESIVFSEQCAATRGNCL
jgi:cobalt-zinc-cadmium efflux system protein